MIKSKIASYLTAALFWIPTIFFSLLLAHNAILYFTHGGEYGILPEKLAARDDVLWNIAFYMHLPTGVICLLSPIVLFSRRFIKRGLRLHTITGKLYTWVTLFLVCPTGMYLALYAKGGIITQAGFMVQGVLLAAFTFRGYRAIQHGDRSDHFHYMIRSYAVAAAVLSFRILHILFFLWRVPYHDNYAISQWLGLSANMLAAEVVIALIEGRKRKSIQLKSIHL